MTITDDELRAVRMCVEAAKLPDDWDEQADPDGPTCVTCGSSYTLDNDGTATPTPDCHGCAHGFAANYRLDVPRLLDEVIELRAALLACQSTAAELEEERDAARARAAQLEAVLNNIRGIHDE